MLSAQHLNLWKDMVAALFTSGPTPTSSQTLGCRERLFLEQEAHENNFPKTYNMALKDQQCSSKFQIGVRRSTLLEWSLHDKVLSTPPLRAHTHALAVRQLEQVAVVVVQLSAAAVK